MPNPNRLLAYRPDHAFIDSIVIHPVQTQADGTVTVDYAHRDADYAARHNRRINREGMNNIAPRYLLQARPHIDLDAAREVQQTGVKKPCASIVGQPIPEPDSAEARRELRRTRWEYTLHYNPQKDPERFYIARTELPVTRWLPWPAELWPTDSIIIFYHGRAWLLLPKPEARRRADPAKPEPESVAAIPPPLQHSGGIPPCPNPPP